MTYNKAKHNMTSTTCHLFCLAKKLPNSSGLCWRRYVKGRILRNILALILLPIIISGCASIRIVESIGESGGCELVSHVSAQGNSEEQVKSRLERKVVKLNGNLLLYNANSGLEVTLHNSKNSLEGVGSAYKCADL